MQANPSLTAPAGDLSPGIKMKSYAALERLSDTLRQDQITEICEELLNESGAVRLTGLFSNQQIAAARTIIMDESERDKAKATHFQGDAAASGQLQLQRRVWNLLAKGKVFSELATQPILMQILGRFLGSEFIMGSIAANRVLPGGPGQQAHIDYPYWDYHEPTTHPIKLNSSFPLNAQVSVLLDPFTPETGATAYVPGSQLTLKYPDDKDDFKQRSQRMIGDPGDVVLFFGAVWHCAMPNVSKQNRSAILIQYLPKFIKPMEDMPATLTPEFIQQASPTLQQLLGLNYPYPEVLEAENFGNTQGRK